MKLSSNAIALFHNEVLPRPSKEQKSHVELQRNRRTKWCPNGFGLMLVIGRGRAFDYLTWYQAVTSVEIVSSIPDRTNLIGEIRWRPPIYGTCSPAHFRKIELEEIGVFPIDRARLDHFFPHLAQDVRGTSALPLLPAVKADIRERQSRASRVVSTP